MKDVVFISGRRYGKSLVAGWRDGKPVYDLTAAAGGKSHIVLNQILAEIEAGRAFGLTPSIEFSDSMTERMLERTMLEVFGTRHQVPQRPDYLPPNGSHAVFRSFVEEEAARERVCTPQGLKDLFKRRERAKPAPPPFKRRY